MDEPTGVVAVCLWLVCTACAIFGSLYAILAGVLVGKFADNFQRASSRNDKRSVEGVTLLKPLYGAEPHLARNLASFLKQDYDGPIQMLCGVQRPADPAVAAVDELRNQFPSRNVTLVQDTTAHGENPKIANILNMIPHRDHDILILSDSDIGVTNGYVQDIVWSLRQPQVGAVTCLYRGHPVGGFWSRMAAASIDQHFLPSVLVGLNFGLAKPCFGSTIALRAETLQRIGGFEAFSNALADDYEIGDAVRKLGLSVAIPAFTVDHTFSDSSLSELVAHELRWARTVRLIDPVGYAASLVTHPLPFALAALPLGSFEPRSFAILALALVCRLFVPIQVERRLGRSTSAIWLSPARDLLSFAVFLLSLLPGSVSWRGQRYQIRPDGSLTPL